MIMKKKPQVVDFFCGAGGFSEGFRQQGFHIVMGIDHWLPAIETHNLNHNLNDSVKNVLDFESIEEIERLPNTEVIVGSPPCVLFSLSNKGGKADKSFGIRLIESFLRVIAVKKHQPSSKLVAWFMENVPNSKNHILRTYTFRQLKLDKWAIQHGYDPDEVALSGAENGRTFNTAHFGAAQKRERFLCGEIVATGAFPDLTKFVDMSYRSIGEVRGRMPKPNSALSSITYADPNYPSLKCKMNLITDHFYDSGIYESQWMKARDLKLNHPYMGSMSFPENECAPSRTIMATRSISCRESLIYKSEHERRGDGEYRLPTIRELATLMGFPYSYQFSGFEGSKWRQVGNAVCPPMSSALAKSVRLAMGLKIITEGQFTFEPPQNKIEKIQDLNTFTTKIFDTPPQKKPNARFRGHPFKGGNMTIALTNYNPVKPSDSGILKEWYSTVFLGTGKGFVAKIIPKNHFKNIGKLIEFHHEDIGRRFINEFERSFADVIGISHKFQAAYLLDDAESKYEPSQLIDRIGKFILEFEPAHPHMKAPELIPEKSQVPTRQVLAMYAINRIVS
jgi:DNA (cytosine-5)-methyltransferase 1